MRPRLASLALLLLALCRSSSAGATVAWGDAIYTADSAVTLAVATRDTQLAKIIKDKTKYADLAPIMGNSLHALMLKGAGKFDALPEYYKKALANGVRCELAEADIDKKVAKAQYGADALTAAQKTEEQTFAKTNHGIDCADTTKADACLCTAGAEKPLLFCLAKKIAGTGTDACRKAAVAELADKGKKALGPALEAMTKITLPENKPTLEDFLKALTEPATLAGVYCDILDATVTPSVAKLYAADALYWTADTTELAGLGNVNVDELCKDEQKKVNPMVKCLCETKAGVLSCKGAMMGKPLKDAAYLDCGATPKFDETKKDAALAAIGQMMGGGGAPQPNPAPGAPTGAPGGNETTTAATGGAATSSSLLLAPLAAAAAALLL